MWHPFFWSCVDIITVEEHLAWLGHFSDPYINIGVHLACYSKNSDQTETSVDKIGRTAKLSEKKRLKERLLLHI